MSSASCSTLVALQAEPPQGCLEVALEQVVEWLQNGVGRAPLARRNVERRCEAGRREVRGAHAAHLARPDLPVECVRDLVLRHIGVVEVRGISGRRGAGGR